MADGITDQGITDGLKTMYGVLNDPIDAMGLSDLAAGSAALTTIAAAANKVVLAMDATFPSVAGAVATSKATAGGTTANFNIKVVTLHNDGAGVNTGVQAYIDGLSLTKPAGVSLAVTVTETDTSA